MPVKDFDTIVCCTEAVDNSAMFLTQGVDGELVKGLPSDPSNDEEIFELLSDSDNKIVFYGLVKMPEWFTEEFYDHDRMFNDPRKCRALLNRVNVMKALAAEGCSTTQYISVEEHNWSYIRDMLHTSKVDLVKANTALVANVKNSEEYNANLGGAKYACKHVDQVGKYRLFIGRDSIVKDGVICLTTSVKKKLSYKETLMHGQSSDVKAALEGMFGDGLIHEDGSKGVEAWSETTISKELPENIKYMGSTASKVISLYDVDFCAVDIIEPASGPAVITNITSCPSIQDQDVLAPVTAYFSELLANGRKMTKEKLVEMVMGLAEDQLSDAGKLLKGMKKLKVPF